MEYFRQYLFFIQFCIISLHLNNFLSDANPLIGETVTQALEMEFPSVVSLATVPATNETNHFCTGTLISKKHVLTCAHCIEIMNETERSWKTKSNIVVSVGSTDVTGGVKYLIPSWKTFNMWLQEHNFSVVTLPHLNHDIAVITLTENVEDIIPARMSKSDFGDSFGKTVVAAGWGHTTMSGDKPRFLQKANLEVIPRVTCVRNLLANNYSANYVLNRFCTIGTSEPIKLACGDSGGPIFINGNELIGVSDAVCAHHDHPNQQNLHLFVYLYREFVEAVIDPSRKEVAKSSYNYYGYYIKKPIP